MNINSTVIWTVFAQTYEATKIIALYSNVWVYVSYFQYILKLDSYLFDTVLAVVVVVVVVVCLLNVWCIPCLQNGKATDMAADHCIGHAQNSWA